MSAPNKLGRACLHGCAAFLIATSAWAQQTTGIPSVSVEPVEEALEHYFSSDSKTVAAGLLFIGAARVGQAFALPADDSPQYLALVDRLANPAIRAPLTIETVDSVYDYILTFKQPPSFQYSREDRKAFKRLDRVLFKRRFFLCMFVDWATNQHPSRKPSRAYTRYFQFAHLVAEAKDRYNAAQAAHESSGNLAELQQKLDSLERQWRTVGRKDKLESAMAEYGILTAKNPATIWSKIDSQYAGAVVSGGAFKLPRTVLYPKASAWSDNAGWQSVSVANIGGGSTQVRIKTITIGRPWLEEQVFGSLSWLWIRSAPLGPDHIVADGRGLATIMTKSKTIGLMPRQLVIATYATDSTGWPRSGFLAGYLASVVAATPKP